MTGNRKLMVALIYMLCATAVALGVVTYKYDTLAGAALFAGGLATGVGAFMWGNAQEHKSKAGGTDGSGTP